MKMADLPVHRRLIVRERQSGCAGEPSVILAGVGDMVPVHPIVQGFQAMVGTAFAFREMSRPMDGRIHADA